MHIGAASNASLVLAAATSNDDMEVQASLSGYNLLWPSSRCCAFELHIESRGRETIVFEVNTGEKSVKKTQATTLAPAQLAQIRSKLVEMDFFHTPTEFGFGAIDGDQRRLRVRLGVQSHTVSIPDAVANDAPVASKKLLLQLNSLWVLVTAHAGIPQP
jgi:hypothetical protein